MQFRRSFLLSSTFLIPLTCGLATSPSAYADEKITLKLDVEPGQAWAFDETNDEDLKTTASAGGQTQNDENKNHSRRVGTIQVLQAKDGRPTSVRLAYSPQCETRMESSGNVQTPPFQLAGKSFTATHKDDGSVETDFAGQVDQGTMSEVKGVFDPNLMLYSDHPVAVGDEWHNADILKRQMQLTGPNDTGDITVKLLSVKDINGRSTAEVSFTVTNSKDMGGVVRTMENSGTALIDVKTGHVMKLEETGTEKLDGTTKGRGPGGKTMPIHWTGTGTQATKVVASASDGSAPAVASGNTNTSTSDATASATPQAAAATNQSPAAAPTAGSSTASGNVARLEPASLMDDPTYIGGEVWKFLVPAGWKTEGSIVWDMTHSYPAQPHFRVSDPQSPAMYEMDPYLPFTWMTNNNGLGYHPQVGAKYAGGIFEPPVNDAYDAITKIVVPTYFKELARAKIVDKAKLPTVAKMALSRMPPLPGAQNTADAARIRFEYQVNGQTVQQDVMAVITFQFQPRFGGNLNWNVDNIISVRAPKGHIDEVAAYWRTMRSSITPNGQWYNKLFQITEGANRQRLVDIQAAAERSRIIAQASNEMNEARKEQFENYQQSVSANGEAFSDYIRDVTTYNTPNGPPVKLPNAYSHAWQGTNGQYIMSNNPNYNPAEDPNNSQFGWTPLQPTQQ